MELISQFGQTLGSEIALTFGLVLAAALVAGTVADLLHLPKVTGYLLIGVALGPSGLHLLQDAQVHELEPLTKLAIGLVLFGLGCHFPISHMRRIGRRLLRLSAGELMITFAVVSFGMLAVGSFFGNDWKSALLFGALALATAPATTVLVLKEAESEGPLTEAAEGLVILNNFASIIVFEMVFLVIALVGGEFPGSLLTGVTAFLISVPASILLGVGLGLLVSLGCGLLSNTRWLVLLVAANTFLLGLAEVLETNYMLGYLAMGLTVANASDDARAINSNIDRLTGFLCVVFFVIHGAELDLNAFLGAGALGAAYVVFRVVGKYLGVFTAATVTHEPPAIRTWLGTALLAQAGAAIALASVTNDREPRLGEIVQPLILGTVVVFEIAGPLLIRLSILRAGEIPLARAVHHTSSTPLDELAKLRTRILVAFGRDPRHRQEPTELKVSDLVRKNVESVDQSASFQEVISLIEHSHDNTYAVTSDEKQLVGIIRYDELSRVMFDQSVADLVRADDLCSPALWKLYLEDSAETAVKYFRISNHDCIPVLSTEDEPKYIGVLRRRDLMQYFRGRLLSDGETSASSH